MSWLICLDYVGKPWLWRAELHREPSEENFRIEKTGVNPWIEVDGGVGPANAYKVIEAGANALVAGSAVFGAKDYAEAIKGIKNSKRPVAVAVNLSTSSEAYSSFSSSLVSEE
ncbi:hypothetical protein Prudu_014988 [Prunus dulcis]|uniref:Aldolase-type TIM barrel family protein n=1 Tax=Prunus dulcis TaxID=3755 RepID=A0A4Y1RJA7_PRUDU|nr:hypothetical protein Prudu_014988 [Prunus dulcis]